MTIVGLALLVALCIPIVAILSDSPIGRALAERLQRKGANPEPPLEAAEDLERRLQLLEGDVELLQHAVDELKEENEFLQRLLEEGPRGTQLPPGGA